MNVSVVILNWNGEKYLNEFLPILLNNLDNVPDAEIVVADNGSTDGSLQLLAEKFPTVKVDAFEKNYGFAGGLSLIHISEPTRPY
jgi:GT2 family glycosyltransferase